MQANPVRVLIVDDSALYRKFIRDVLTGSDDIEVVGTAHNGQVALEKIASLQPDLVTLDFDMPELGGLDVLAAIRRQGLRTGAIMCSSLTSYGAAITTHALELGAFDFVLKPDQAGSLETNVGLLKNDLLPKVRAFGASHKRLITPVQPDLTSASKSLSNAPGTNGPPSNIQRVRPEIVVIGVSTGGPSALNQILPQLPTDFPIPILIVQHMPPLFTKSLANDLHRICKISVSEAADGDRLRPGHISIAPGGKQMKVELGPQGLCLRITNDPPERNCKPSVDYLFRSVAAIYGGKVLGIILTGMGDDGTEGCRELKKCRATVWTQDEASSVVYGMPRSVAEQNLMDQSFPLDQFPAEITRFVNRTEKICR